MAQVLALLERVGRVLDWCTGQRRVVFGLDTPAAARTPHEFSTRAINLRRQIWATAWRHSGFNDDYGVSAVE